MSKKISIISGKGGSGKTSIAFALSKALVNIGLKVAFIDCDMSTHGATFFVRSNIGRSKVDNIVSVDTILKSKDIPKCGYITCDKNGASHIDELSNVIKIEENLYFMPSDISISNIPPDENITYYYNSFNKVVLDEIDSVVDIIVFDCQAGYSEFTRNLLGVSDICLLVSEPDGASAAANRALCFQMGKEFEKISPFQIFNKITEEEFEYYGKVSASAFFINLYPVLYSWRVRKAIALLQIPCEENIGIDFGVNIAKILYDILPEYRQQISTYQRNLLNKKKTAIENRLRDLNYESRNLRKSKLLKYGSVVFMLCILISYVAIGVFNKNNSLESLETIAFMTFMFFAATVLFIATNYNSKTSKLYKIEEEMANLNKILFNYDGDIQNIIETDKTSS